jgi:hypothetical protein
VKLPRQAFISPHKVRSRIADERSSGPAIVRGIIPSQYDVDSAPADCEGCLMALESDPSLADYCSALCGSSE